MSVNFLLDLGKNACNGRMLLKIIGTLSFFLIGLFLFSVMLPEGVNRVFSERLFSLLSVMTALGVVLFFAYLKRKPEYRIRHEEINARFDSRDLILILLPMTPIAGYIILNIEILSLPNALAILLCFTAISAFFSFLLPALAMQVARKPLMMLGLSYSFVLFNMASLSSGMEWHLAGSFPVQAGAMALCFALCMLGYHKNRTFFRYAAAIFFIVTLINSLIPSLEGTGKRTVRTGELSGIYTLTEEKKPETTPDIFLLTYESYTDSETLFRYGIDNSVHENYLEDKGFHIYRGTYSVAASSLSSMSRVLNISQGVVYPRSVLAGNGAVHKILKKNGYTTYGIFYINYFFQKVGSFYDVSFPEQLPKTCRFLINAILEGEFRFDASYEETGYGEFLDMKRKVLASKTPYPKFLYAHNKYPGHSQNSGSAIGNETGIYTKGIAEANAEMKTDIETAINNNPGAVIIVHGDHGPYLTKNCTRTGKNNAYDISEINRLDVQDRYGSFLAIRWPKGTKIDHDKIEILQDIFPSVFAWMYDDPDILKSRIEQLTLFPDRVSGVRVRKGILEGGQDDGKPLFDTR
ncbi:MAG TPA: hypothetical protein PKN36_10560 [bacterium]|nr:hypothetical protein [bacterium]